MKKLITALSLIAIILIISACSPAGGDTSTTPGTIDPGTFAKLHLDAENTTVFTGSIELLKSSSRKGAVIQFQTDTEKTADVAKEFRAGSAVDGAGIGNYKEQTYISSPYDKDGIVKLDIEIEAKEILRMKDMLISILAENSGQPYDKVKEDCDRDHFLSAREAMEYGLIDKVVERNSL